MTSFALLLLFLLCQPLFAGGPLTLREVLSHVETQYPVVQGADREVEASRGDLEAADGAFDLLWKNRLSSSALGYYDNVRFDSVVEKPLAPWGANVFAGYRRGTGTFAVYDEKALTLSRGEARVGFEVSLWRNRSVDRRRANQAKAVFAITASEAAALQTRIESVRSASQRYWDWVAAGKRRTIFQSLLTIAKARDEGLRERVLHGDLPEIERKDNERTILQRQAQLVGAERALQQAAIELSLFLRDRDGQPRLASETELPADFPFEHADKQWNLEEETRRAWEQRPELRRLEASREQSSVEMDWAGNQLAPRVDVQVAATRDFGSGSVTRAGTELEASLFVEVPLERRLASGRQAQARATRDRWEAAERMMRDRIAAEVRDSLSVLQAALTRRHIAAQETQLARALEEAERTRFDHGDSNVLFVNLREQATADALVREIEAASDYEKGLAQRAAAVGER